MFQNSTSCKIIKYADDTAILGLIKNNDCTLYMETINNVTEWCKDNCLDLNVSKTKEMLFDFRRVKPEIRPVCIDDTNVDVVKTYKYLGVNIECNLKWEELVIAHVKKANKRLYHLRCLRKLSVDSTLMCLCYNSLISSVLLYAVSVWYGSCGVQLRKDIAKTRKRAARIIGCSGNHLTDPDSTHRNRCVTLAKKIINDELHPLHQYYRLLPHGRRYAALRCRTARFKDTFLPTSIRFMNC